METHDPLCHQDPCLCVFIARVRAHERLRWSPRKPVIRGHAAVCWCDECMGTAVGPT